MSDVQRDIGSLEARMDEHEKRLDRMESKLDKLVAFSERAQGGWRTLAVVGSIAGAVGAIAAKLLPWWKG